METKRKAPMERLYAPWRKNYVTNKDGKTPTCVFCDAFAASLDQENFILERSAHSVVMLNRFPYNGGHLLVLPLQHQQKLHAISAEEQSDLMALIAKWSKILEDELKAQGLNVGINMGEAGGGGIPQHLHIHILPRWNSDTSFLPLLSDTKMVSVDLKKIYAQLKKHA